jgi:hypothetical protein
VGESKKLRKRRAGISRKVSEHVQKLEDQKRRINPDWGAIHHWEREIANWERQIAEIDRRLKG